MKLDQARRGAGGGLRPRPRRPPQGLLAALGHPCSSPEREHPGRVAGLRLLGSLLGLARIPGARPLGPFGSEVAWSLPALEAVGGRLPGRGLPGLRLALAPADLPWAVGRQLAEGHGRRLLLLVAVSRARIPGLGGAAGVGLPRGGGGGGGLGPSRGAVDRGPGVAGVLHREVEGHLLRLREASVRGGVLGCRFGFLFLREVQRGRAGAVLRAGGRRRRGGRIHGLEAGKEGRG